MLIKNKDSVTFIFDKKSRKRVYLAGDFNDWGKTKIPMKRTLSGKWKVELKLSKGEYQFKYNVDDQWYNDHEADKYVSNNFGVDNSVVVIS